ncbi:MAG: hypothetical protein WC648_02460 [Candidatus Paceibacterota bacterium]
MLHPKGGSDYARKIRLKGRTFGQPQEVVVVGSWEQKPSREDLEEARRREDVRRSNFRFCGLNPWL